MDTEEDVSQHCGGLAVVVARAVPSLVETGQQPAESSAFLELRHLVV